MEVNLRAFLSRLESLEELEEQDVFGKEFQGVRAGVDMDRVSVEVGKERCNMKKNRYKDILPFDQTRVPLTLLAGDGYGDYINANFIQGIDETPEYIATQGPLINTVIDLWRMVWQYRVTVIVMACREIELGKRKCERYWAIDKEPVAFGPFTVANMGEESLGMEVIVRRLSVTLHGEARTVTQFHYLAWPDHGIPGNVDGLLGIVERVHQEFGEERERGPVCVHCSAGCGRTGVICTVDYIWRLLKNKRVGEGFSISALVQRMRVQRPAAVQTKDQYHFVYKIVGEMFRRELETKSSLYANWEQTSQPTQRDGVEKLHLVEKKPVPLPKPKRPPHPQGMMSDTYASVSRQRSPPTADASCYVNVAPPPPPPPQPKPRARTPSLSPSTPPTLNYSALSFPSPQPGNVGNSGKVEDEQWAPSLPQRTADSYLVEAASLSRESSFSSNDGIPSGTIHSARKMVFPGTSPEKKVPTATERFDDGYEDITNIIKATGLGFNTRVKKPKGPRDPPTEWSLYGR